MEDLALRDSDPERLVGQINARSGVVLIACEGGCSCWGINQPSVSDDFGLRCLNLRTWCCFGGAASIVLMDSKPQMPLVLSRTQSLLG